MLAENDRFRDYLGVTAWNKAGYTGLRGLSASGENFNINAYHKKATAFAFHEIAPCRELIYPLETLSGNVAGIERFTEMVGQIKEKQIDTFFGSYEDSGGGGTYDELLKPVSRFSSLFMAVGNDGESKYSHAVRSDYILGVAAVSLYGSDGVNLTTYSSVTEYVDFSSFAGLWIEFNGQLYLFSGTSCSTPVLSAMAALVNHMAIEKRGMPLSIKGMEDFFKDCSTDLYITGKDDKTGWGLPILPPPESVDIWRYDGMLNSRDIDQLRPDVAANCKKFIEMAKKDGYPVLVTGTVRDEAYQRYCYANGKSNTPVPSFHGVKAGLAFDICKNVKGEEYSDNDFWTYCGALGQKMGFEWGGAWTSIVDKPHFQWSDGKKYTSSMIRAGDYPPDMPLYEEVENLTQAETQTLIDKSMSESKEAVYATADEIPEWGKATVAKLMEKGAISGDESGLNIPYSMLRILVILDRLKILD